MGFLKRLCNKIGEGLLLGGRKDPFQSPETPERVELGLDILNGYVQSCAAG